MKKNISSSTLLGLSLLIASCGMPSKSELVFDDSTSLGLNPDTVVTFNDLKSEILDAKCVSCHSNASTETGLQQWIVPGNPQASSFFIRTENGSMPKNGPLLSTRELELISTYITQLAQAPTPDADPSPEPDPTPAPTPPPTGNPGVSFAEIKTNILQPYRCTSCHSVNTEAALSKWLNKTSPASSRFYTITKSGVMPENGPRVTDKDMELILQYVKDYAARN
jgi:mono/diheme cytochrome c family protein